MKVTLLLCDHAQVSDGKLYVLGAGWSVTGPGPINMAVGIIVDVPWDRTNHEIVMTLELRESDGQLVTQPGPAGPVPVSVDAGFEVGRPPGVAAGSHIPVAFAVPIQNMQLTPGRRFYWQLTADRETHDDWTLHFATRHLPPAPGGPADIGFPHPS